MIGARNRSLRVAVVAVWLAAFFVTRAARADVAVSIQVETEEQLELAHRVRSELSSEGYGVEIRSGAERSPCDPEGAQVGPVDQRVWIRLAADPSAKDAIVASICYLGTLPFLQRASVSAPSGEPNQLALATAEALNGLRSRLPPLAVNPERDAPDEHARPSAGDRRMEAVPPGEPRVNGIVLGTALVLNLPDFPVAPGVVGRATLGVVPSVGIAIDAFVPTTGRELSSSEVTATVRTTWLRVGPRFRGAAGDFELSIATLAGPALTWATGVARAPRVGTTDVTTAAVLSLAAFVEYPRNAAVFASASASASALVPGVRVALGDGATPPRGSWPLEASIGFGARWGDRR